MRGVPRHSARTVRCFHSAILSVQSYYPLCTVGDTPRPIGFAVPIGAELRIYNPPLRVGLQIPVLGFRGLQIRGDVCCGGIAWAVSPRGRVSVYIRVRLLVSRRSAEYDYFNSLRSVVFSSTCICCMAMWFSLMSRSFCAMPSFISTAFRLSMFERHISSFTEA